MMTRRAKIEDCLVRSTHIIHLPSFRSVLRLTVTACEEKELTGSSVW